MPGLPGNLPVLRVQDECAYYKEDAGKLLVGCFEPVAKPWGMTGIPEDFSFETLPEDYDHFEPILNAAIKRVPALADAGIQLFFNGPESFTPDDRYYIGESPGSARPVRGHRFQFGGHRGQRRCGQGGGAMDPRPPGAHGPVRCGHPPGHAVPGAIDVICTIARSRLWASCTRCTGRTTSTRPRAARGARPCTTVWSRPVPAWARRQAGSGPTGLPRQARSPATPIRTGGRTGSRPAPVNAERRASRRAVRSMLFRQVSGAGSRLPAPSSITFRPRMWTWRPDASSTRSGSTIAAASRRI